MNTLSAVKPGFRPAPAQPDDDRFVALAAELGHEFSGQAAEHDRENTLRRPRTSRGCASRVTSASRCPTELGGLGASMRQVCYAQAELAKHCASTALAVNMHLYLVLANTYRWRHGATRSRACCGGSPTRASSS